MSETEANLPGLELTETETPKKAAKKAARKTAAKKVAKKRVAKKTAATATEAANPAEAAEAAATEGKSLEVIDLRTLSPLDMGPVYDSVRRTGRAIVTHEAHVNLGMGSEVASRIQERCFYSLEAPVLRVGGFDTPDPASRVEEEWLPDLDRILDAVDRSLDW